MRSRVVYLERRIPRNSRTIPQVSGLRRELLVAGWEADELLKRVKGFCFDGRELFCPSPSRVRELAAACERLGLGGVRIVEG